VRFERGLSGDPLMLVRIAEQAALGGTSGDLACVGHAESMMPSGSSVHDNAQAVMMEVIEYMGRKLEVAGVKFQVPVVLEEVPRRLIGDHVSPAFRKVSTTGNQQVHSAWFRPKKSAKNARSRLNNVRRLREIHDPVPGRSASPGRGRRGRDGVSPDDGLPMRPSSTVGAEHEPVGEAILLKTGVSPELAMICMSHARWRRMHVSLEELIVALAATVAGALPLFEPC
jgi:hypothetical protein